MASEHVGEERQGEQIARSSMKCSRSGAKDVGGSSAMESANQLAVKAGSESVEVGYGLIPQQRSTEATNALIKQDVFLDNGLTSTEFEKGLSRDEGIIMDSGDDPNANLCSPVPKDVSDLPYGVNVMRELSELPHVKDQDVVPDYFDDNGSERSIQHYYRNT